MPPESQNPEAEAVEAAEAAPPESVPQVSEKRPLWAVYAMSDTGDIVSYLSVNAGSQEALIPFHRHRTGNLVARITDEGVAAGMRRLEAEKIVILSESEPVNVIPQKFLKVSDLDIGQVVMAMDDPDLDPPALVEILGIARKQGRQSVVSNIEFQLNTLKREGATIPSNDELEEKRFRSSFGDLPELEPVEGLVGGFYVVHMPVDAPDISLNEIRLGGTSMEQYFGKRALQLPPSLIMREAWLAHDGQCRPAIFDSAAICGEYLIQQKAARAEAGEER